jgi:Family of unknown function (DUF5677)
MEEEASDLSTASRVLYSLGETLREKLLEKPIPTMKTPLVFFFARGFMTYQAIIRLWEGGFWQDAAVLSRSLREASYQARWAAKCGDEAAGLFMQDHERNWRKVMRTISEIAAPDVKSKALEIVADIKPDAELDVWWHNWWGKEKSIYWLTKQIGAKDAYLIEYAALSAFVHSSPAVLTHYLAPDSERGGFALRTRSDLRSNREFAHAILWTTLAAFADLCAVLGSELGLDCGSQLEEAGEALARIVEES